MSHGPDVCFRQALIIDGTGQPARVGDVHVQDQRITRIDWDAPEISRRASTEIDARGLVLCPGFIDIHSHSIQSLLTDGRCISKISQGITTEIMGETWTPGPVNDNVPRQLGDLWHWPRLGQWLETMGSQGISPNVGTMLAGHNIRAGVMGMSMEAPSAEQLRAMGRIVEEGMEDGAFGLSYALIYPPDVYAEEAEIIAMCRIAAAHGGIYCTHLRSEGQRLLEGVEEALRIGMAADIPVEIYHLKASGKNNWHKMPTVIDRIARAREQGVDVEASMYAYTASGTGLTTVLPPWSAAGGQLQENLEDPIMCERLRQEVLNPQGDWEPQLAVTGAEQILLLDLRQPENHAYRGKRLSEAAAMMGMSPVDAAIALLRSEKQRVFSVFFKMSEENIELQMRQPWVKFSTDAPGHNGQDQDGPVDSRCFHPRCYGSMPRVLGHYVRQRRVLSIESAIARMTGQVARRLGLKDRGWVKEGMQADLVLLDAKNVIDHATYDQPHELSTGVRGVWVNGVKVWDGQRHTGAMPGQVLRRQDRRAGASDRQIMTVTAEG